MFQTKLAEKIEHSLPARLWGFMIKKKGREHDKIISLYFISFERAAPKAYIEQ
jgi:hypothetical protein